MSCTILNLSINWESQIIGNILILSYHLGPWILMHELKFGGGSIVNSPIISKLNIIERRLITNILFSIALNAWEILA